MVLALFYYTLIVLLCSILTSTICLSAYLVSHKKMMLYAFLGFLFYFFDVAWAFQADFFSGARFEVGSVYGAVMSVAYIVTGGGALTAFWFLICDYLDEKRELMKIMPTAAFVVSCFSVLILLPENNLREFLFFLPRELYLFWMLLYGGRRYLLSRNEDEWKRLERHKVFYALLWVLGLCVVLEDALAFLLPEPMLVGPRAYTPERNISENVLMLCCMAVTVRNAGMQLSLRFEKPPVGGGGHREQAIDDGLLAYGRRYQLSDRECEVLRYVLMGDDNQNIASSMHLALSTVKVHVHNILQKTGQANRQALVQDFWKMS